MGVRHVNAPAGARKYGIISNPATRIIKKRLVVIIKYRGQKKKETTPPVATFFYDRPIKKKISTTFRCTVFPNDNLARNVLNLIKKCWGESVG